MKTKLQKYMLSYAEKKVDEKYVLKSIHDFSKITSLQIAYTSGFQDCHNLLAPMLLECLAALEFYKNNAMTLKRGHEISSDVVEYCNGEIAEDCLSTISKQLEGLG